MLDAAAADRVDALRLPCLLNLAACRLREARPFEAISACDAAVGINAGSAKAWYRRGQARAALGQRRGCAEVTAEVAISYRRAQPSASSRLRARICCRRGVEPEVQPRGLAEMIAEVAISRR